MTSGAKLAAAGPAGSRLAASSPAASAPMRAPLRLDGLDMHQAPVEEQRPVGSLLLNPTAVAADALAPALRHPLEVILGEGERTRDEYAHLAERGGQRALGKGAVIGRPARRVLRR